MIYESHLRATEENAWPLDTSIAWDAIDLEVAGRERDLHQALHDAALIEGYLPVYAARLMQLLWDDVDATAVLSMELYEGLKHFTALARYLDRVGFQREEVSEATLVAARGRALGIEYDKAELIAHLNVLSLRSGVYIDPEDWSSNRTRYLPPIPAGGSLTLTWRLQAVNAGSIGVYVAVLPQSVAAKPPTTSPTTRRRAS